MAKELLVDEDCPAVRARRQELENGHDAELEDVVHELGRGWMLYHLTYCERCVAFRREYGTDTREV